MEFFKNSDWHLTDCFLMKGKELQNYLMISFWSGFKWVKRLSIYMAALKSLLFQGYFFFKKTQFVAEFLKNSDWLSSRLFLWKKMYLVFQFPRLRKNIRLLGCSEFASNLKVERRILIYEFDEIGRYFEKGPYGAFGA